MPASDRTAFVPLVAAAKGKCILLGVWTYFILSHDKCYLECNSGVGENRPPLLPWFSSTCLGPWNLQSLIYKMNVSHGIRWRTQILRVRTVIPNWVALSGSCLLACSLVAGGAWHHLVRNYHSPPLDLDCLYSLSFIYVVTPLHHNFAKQVITWHLVSRANISHRPVKSVLKCTIRGRR